MQCENCKMAIPEDDCPYCESCNHVFYLFTWNYISDEDRAERLKMLRLFQQAVRPAQVLLGRDFVATMGPRFANQRGGLS